MLVDELPPTVSFSIFLIEVFLPPAVETAGGFFPLSMLPPAAYFVEAARSAADVECAAFQAANLC